MKNTNVYDVIVIGGGQAGFAIAYYLQKEKLNFLILEGESEAVGSWPQYYESLMLFSPARYSSLPGYTFEGAQDRYPLKKEVIQYLRQYQKKYQFPIHTDTIVESVERVDSLFIIHSRNGRTYTTKSVISATGAFNQPVIPSIENDHLFKGDIIHSKNYKDPNKYVGKRIIVVGAGNSAVQIAVELANVGNVTIATKSPIKYLRQRFLGMDIHFWINIIGYDQFPIGRWLNMTPMTSVLDLGNYEKAIRNNKPNHKRMFTRFTEGGVVWEDGSEEKVDVVIFATGFNHNAKYLKKLNAIDSNEKPVQKNGVSSTTEGLYFLGISWQRSHASATIRGVGKDAKYIVSKLKKYLKTSKVDMRKTNGCC